MAMEKGRRQGEAGLEGLMRGLKLTEEERRGLKGSWRSESGEKEKAPQAVGKLFSTKPGRVDGMVQTLGRIWCPVKGVRCKELGDNLFLFTFLQAGGKRRAITEGPWEFNGDLLIVVDFDETKRLKDLEFTHIPVWVRVFNLPLGLMNDKTGRLIGDEVGRALEVDTEEDGSAVGSYLRVKIMIDVRKPLFRGVTMEDAEGEKGSWCHFQYEFLPNFCYSCGILGHVEKECDAKVWKEVHQQFGDWMRVNPAKQRDLRGRWSEGGSSGGSYQQRTSGSWRKSEAGGNFERKGQEQKGHSSEDPELRDTGSSPLKTPNILAKGGEPKKLTFGEDGSADKERREPGLDQDRTGELVPGEGHMVGAMDKVVGKGGTSSTMLDEGGEDGGDMDVDGLGNFAAGPDEEIRVIKVQQSNEKGEQHNEKVDPPRKPKVTFRRRPRTPVAEGGEGDEPPSSSRKRSVPKEDGSGEGQKKLKVVGEVTNAQPAGLRGQSRLDQ